jgi:hypothetical protein
MKQWLKEISKIFLEKVKGLGAEILTTLKTIKYRYSTLRNIRLERGNSLVMRR